ncbi:MAG TPA: YfiR family protein [Opitutaceae bacterium]|nr:YfiR family protein [Opitutaceae bacterium]
MAFLIPSEGLPGRSGRRRAFIGALALLALLSLRAPAASVELAAAREYQVKAVFLFNFAQFVDWPPAAFAEPNTPLVIGVLGDDPFRNYLDETVRGETANARPIVIERFRRVEDIKTCHVLFISRSETGRLDQIFANLRGRNILTVGDAEGFAQHGGMIRFVIDNNKVRFRINLEAAKAANLTISSKLLRPAEIVAPGKD